MPLGGETVGEIWIRGGNVAKGYWQNPEATKETFAARTARGEGPYLRSGDLGFLRGGELFVTGRLKDLIIIRGKNHYPQDIERTVESSYPSLRQGCSAAFSIHAAGEERLVVVAEVDRSHGVAEGKEPPGLAPLGPDRVLPFAPASIIGAIRAAVSGLHGVPVFAVALVSAKTIAKTSSGKIQRHECRRAFEDGTLEVLADHRDDGSLRDLSAATS
jgi:acyl-CoA synthetase (AMP-forming)/AMP-acid ligase II